MKLCNVFNINILHKFTMILHAVFENSYDSLNEISEENMKLSQFWRKD